MLILWLSVTNWTLSIKLDFNQKHNFHKIEIFTWKMSVLPKPTDFPRETLKKCLSGYLPGKCLSTPLLPPAENKPRDVFWQCCPEKWPHSLRALGFQPPCLALQALSLSTALWLWKAAGHVLPGHGMCTWETPKHTRELKQGAHHKRQDQFGWCTCPAAKDPSYFTPSQNLRPSFIYFFIYYILQLHLSLTFLLTYLCLLSKTFFIRNNFHFQAGSRLEIQSYLSESDNENITHVQTIKS